MVNLKFSEMISELGSNTEDVRSKDWLSLSFNGVSTDSRSPDLGGKLFIPLKGDNFDGHNFISNVCEKGVAGVLFETWREEWEPFLDNIVFIPVKNTLAALQKLASHWRKMCDTNVIGLTGSNGKTTTKDFLGQILSPHYRVLINQGSFNNHWGVPLTLLKLKKDTEILVAEMGMNSPGEIRDLVGMADPNWVGCTNVGRAHYGFFSTVEEIADAKEEIYRFSKKDGKAVFNLDNPYTKKFKNRWGKENSISYSLKDSKSDVFF